MEQPSPIQRAQHLLSLQSGAKSRSEVAAGFSEFPMPLSSVEVNDDLKKRKEEQELSHQDKRFESEMEQRRINMELKKAIATLVFRFLATETLALFLVVMLQGFAPFEFHLEDSTINVFLAATLLQISSMAVIITRHLYPTSQS